MTETRLALIDAALEPGLVPHGFADGVLARASEVDDPELLWDGATTLAGLAQKWTGHVQERDEFKVAQMYCEIELGDRLGPRPAWGNRHQEQDLDIARDIIPQPRVSELQRFYGYREPLIEAVRDGKRSRKALLRLVEQWDAANSDVHWLVEELQLRDKLEAGTAVLVNLRRHKRLCAWAARNGLLVRIDRTSIWGNPYLLGDDGDRQTVIANYRDHYLQYKPSLLMQLGDELERKALACWCAPEPCHGDVLLEELEGLLLQEATPCHGDLLVTMVADDLPGLRDAREDGARAEQ